MPAKSLDLGNLRIGFVVDTTNFDKLIQKTANLKRAYERVLRTTEKLKSATNNLGKTTKTTASTTEKLNSATDRLGKKTKTTASTTAKLNSVTEKLNSATNSLGKTTKTLASASQKLASSSNITAKTFEKNTRAIRKLNNSINRMANNLKRTDKQVKRTTKSAKTAGNVFKRLSGLILAAFSVRLIARFAIFTDRISVMRDRLRFFTQATNSFVKANNALISSVIRTGTSLQSNLKLFQSLTLVSKDLGATQDDILTLTDSVSKLGVIGGSSTQDIKFALRQLAQGFAAGILRAEEFNSVIENTPVIAERIARGMGVTTGQLRLAVIEGKVLSKDVFDSLLKQSKEIEADFAKLPITLERGFSALKTSTSAFFAILAENTGVLRSLGGVFREWGKAIQAVNARLEEQRTPLEVSKDRIDTLNKSIVELKKNLGGVSAPDVEFSGKDFFKKSIAGFLSEGKKLAPLISKTIGGFLGTTEKFKPLRRTPLVKDKAALLKELRGTQSALDEETKKFQALQVDRVANAEADRLETIKAARNRSVEFIKNAEDFSQAIEFKGLDVQKSLQEAKLKSQIDFLKSVLKNEQLNLKEKAALQEEATKRELSLQRSKQTVSIIQQTEGAKRSVDVLRNQTSQVADLSRVVFEINKAATVSSILLATPKAVADAYAAGVSIGGPFALISGAAFALTASAAQGAQLGAALSTSFKRRQFGGPVSRNSAFEVAEQGPELLTMGDRSVLLTGNKSGDITSNQALNSMSNGTSKAPVIKVNIFPLAGETATVQSGTDAFGEQEIDIILRRVDERIANNISEGIGKTNNAIENTFRLNRGVSATA